MKIGTHQRMEYEAMSWQKVCQTWLLEMAKRKLNHYVLFWCPHVKWAVCQMQVDVESKCLDRPVSIQQGWLTERGEQNWWRDHNGGLQFLEWNLKAELFTTANIWSRSTLVQWMKEIQAILHLHFNFQEITCDIAQCLRTMRSGDVTRYVYCTQVLSHGMVTWKELLENFQTCQDLQVKYL